MGEFYCLSEEREKQSHLPSKARGHGKTGD
jgi:hypothetical protein